jgi:hypothetical protein
MPNRGLIPRTSPSRSPHGVIRRFTIDKWRVRRAFDDFSLDVNVQ